MDRACGYKRGVAGPNEIDQNDGHIQTSDLPVPYLTVTQRVLDATNALTSAYNCPFMDKTRVAV